MGMYAWAGRDGRTRATKSIATTWTASRRWINARAISSVFVLAGCVAVCTGCGGSGSETPSDNSGSGGPPVGARDDRAVFFDAVSAKLLSYDGTNPDQEDQDLLTFLQASPEVIDSGISSSGGVWAILSDGRPFVIANNIDRSESLAVSSLSSMGHRATALDARKKPEGLPTTGNVVLGTGFGSYFDAATSEVSDLFVAQNYSPASDGASVEALKLQSNTGVVYLTTHGALAPIRRGGAPVFIAWTSTPRAPDGSSDALYAADLNDGSLTYFTALTFNGDPSHPALGASVHYGITSKFVAKYWTGKFNSNSLVFISACHSADPLSLEFELAALNAGASLYLGWSDTMVIPQAVVSGAYLFDRLLGTNAVDPMETPPQRAFSWAPVLADMATHKRSNMDQTLDTTFSARKGVTAKLMPLTLGGQFAQLAPSIESLTVDEQNDELIVNGYFGDPQGDVWMNGSPMTIKTWTSTQIHCALMRSGSDASGDVQVIAANPRQSSNVVQLTEWSGSLTATYKGKGSLQMLWTFNVHFRADVHDRRLAPHQAPVMPLADWIDALDTNGSFSFSGSYVDPAGAYREEWSGSGSLPSYVTPPPGTSGSPTTSVVVQGSFDSNHNWSMSANATALSALMDHVITYGPGSVVTSDTTEAKNAGWLSVGDMNGNPNVAVASKSYDVPGGTVTNNLNGEGSTTLTWTAMAAKRPPDTNPCPDPVDPSSPRICVAPGR